MLAWLALSAPVAPGQDASAEHQIKAAFLYKFGSYVEWPAEAFGDAGTPFTVGVLGADELARDLQAVVAERTMAGRSVVVRLLQPGDPLNGLQMVFVGRAATASLESVLSASDDFPILVVTEAAEDIPPGGLINFIVSDNKVRFDVDLAAAERRKLRISSRLLAVARNVVPAS